MNYYNEVDSDAAQWLRNLIAEGLVPPGDVDERSIEDVRPVDLDGYAQCHFFAGVGGWPEALRLAGVPDDEPLWTGSCPCQPYSAAGARRGSDDPRNLWWAFRWLIDQRRPPVVLGEQVASKDGRAWLAGVRADLEALGYAVGAADLCAAGAGPEGEGWIVRGDREYWDRLILGAPHIRQRLFWVADADGRERRRVATGEERLDDGTPAGWFKGDRQSATSGAGDGMADATVFRRREERSNGRGIASGDRAEGIAAGHEPGCSFGGVDHGGRSGPVNGFWRDADWLFCTDGKWRPVEPGSFPLAHGVPARVGRLRAYGNAIVPQVAAEFITAWRTVRCPF